MSALRLLAGPRALQHLRQHGLRPQDVRVMPAAAGGPKGLILGPLDAYLFGKWLPQSGQSVHLLGASIGAWRMAAACMADPLTALQRLTDDYIRQDYAHEPGKAPSPALVSQMFAQTLEQHFGGREAELLNNPRYRLHVFASHGLRWLSREARGLTALGYGAAYFANLRSRPALGRWLERVVFSDPREPLPLALNDFPGCTVALSAANLAPSVLASCTIPFWLSAVHDIPGAPRGAYWDGGLTDYHLHLPYNTMADGLVLYPHFQSSVVPGWLDKALRHRHRATPALDNMVLLAPRPEWVAGLPGGKLPDRSDFKTWADDLPGRMAAWRTAVAESERLADEFAGWAEGRVELPLEPL